MEVIDVIREIYYYQKGHHYRSSKSYKIVFLVDRRANKVMIKKAFKTMFGVQPEKVNTQNRHPQPARIMPKSRKNFTKAKKIAFIYLKKEDFEKLRQLFAMETIPEEFQSMASTLESEVAEAAAAAAAEVEAQNNSEGEIKAEDAAKEIQVEEVGDPVEIKKEEEEKKE
ncbi:50S ribosomal protein L23 [Mycoplasma suis]|uniref:50S ribosomal protein L23 n=1 Tax=Mycoplasma suis (strain Illinois) TaxID=768700 RepID=F0QR37_MYCSL|nr:50S ribosomal protein L23 [Mycoplasma suis]ADX97957.1 50S ribosomal protein L23 [Mycoplasma suis str. Illinois]